MAYLVVYLVLLGIILGEVVWLGLALLSRWVQRL